MHPSSCSIEPLGPWTAHIQAMDHALSKNDPGESMHTWRRAYSAALSDPGWLGLLTVASASLRLGAFPSLAQNAATRAREAYWIALFRARQQRSLKGVLCTAEAFSMLGDRAAFAQCTRAAAALAANGGDSDAVNLVRCFAERLADQGKAVS